MKKNYNVEFWNFVCHFGEHKLLDFYSELVHPAFTNGLTRDYGENCWFFHNVELLTCNFDGNELPFVYGRIIKDTVLRRTQYFSEGELKEDEKGIQSSPSSIFILSLIDHRLFFVKEQSDSPTMENFKSTITKFIKDIRTKLIDDEYRAAKEIYDYNGGSNGKLHRTTKKNLGVRFPEPNIEIIAQSSDAGIDEFVRGMKSIDQLQLEVITPNNESDCNGFFEAIRKKDKQVGVKKSTHTYRKKDGVLAHDNISDISKEANKDENVQITLKGKDIHNDKLIGTNDSFKLVKRIDEIEEIPTLFTKSVYESFMELIKDGIIRGPKISDMDKVKEKLSNILKIIR
ncbi:hypothetical protein [Shewanella sp. KCT]|uniref:hypothetical protein n=1 Tax=Shewanella sp. KCT TaxID=2569535 RepID=UPI001181F3D0|nr:hypothetical protein [Shewanella sp. KCT]TVP14284.1 hypothetical protein AYI87_10615 [Shewanella sp. KCT]